LLHGSSGSALVPADIFPNDKWIIAETVRELIGGS
jgi:hypothetical protein